MILDRAPANMSKVYFGYRARFLGSLGQALTAPLQCGIRHEGR
jgi:hypothetical protein